MLVLLTEVSLLSQISLKDGLDFVQTTGLFSVLGFLFRQYIIHRDFRRDTQRDIKEIKERETKIEDVTKQFETEIKGLTDEIREFRHELKMSQMFNEFKENLERKTGLDRLT